jgi:hypothetical protein
MICAASPVSKSPGEANDRSMIVAQSPLILD